MASSQAYEWHGQTAKADYCLKAILVEGCSDIDIYLHKICPLDARYSCKKVLNLYSALRNASNALSVQVHSERDASLVSSWNCRHWATGLGGHQAAHSRPSDRRQRTPDGQACCVVVRRDGGGWKIKVADDWQRPMWGGSSSRGTGEPCLGDTGEMWIRHN